MAMTILVVDDSVTMVLSLKTALSMNGFQVETAHHGQAALDKLQSGLKPNLILTDINMPVMGAWNSSAKFVPYPAFALFPSSR